MAHLVTHRDKSRQAPASDPRHLPNYRLPEAAHYLRVPVSTLRSWVFGQAYPTATEPRRSKPIIAIPEGDPPRLSFVNMVEAHVLSGIRYQHGVSLMAVRRAMEYLTRELGSKHPLAEEEFQTASTSSWSASAWTITTSSTCPPRANSPCARLSARSCGASTETTTAWRYASIPSAGARR